MLMPNSARIVNIALKYNETCVGLVLTRRVDATTHQQLSGTRIRMRNIAGGRIDWLEGSFIFYLNVSNVSTIAIQCCWFTKKMPLHTEYDTW